MIVNAVLNEHQIVVDIVAFVNKGDFPRSRLGEKQRGKILGSWVTRKMRTMAQFGIRDPDSGLSDVTETMEPRSGVVSLGKSSVVGNSLRNVENTPKIVEEHEFERQGAPAQDSFVPLPTGISEMPAQNYSNSIVASPTSQTDTATEKATGHVELPTNELDAEKSNGGENEAKASNSSLPDAGPPPVGPKPVPRMSLPAVEGREGDLWTLSSQAGGLKVQNGATDDEDESWKSDAIMHMNLAGR